MCTTLLQMTLPSAYDRTAALLREQQRLARVLDEHARASKVLEQQMRVEQQMRDREHEVRAASVLPCDRKGEWSLSATALAADTCRAAIRGLSMSERLIAGVTRIHSDAQSIHEANLNRFFRSEFAEFIKSTKFDHLDTFTTLVGELVQYERLVEWGKFTAPILWDTGVDASLHEFFQLWIGPSAEIPATDPARRQNAPALTARTIRDLWADVIEQLDYVDVLSQTDEAYIVERLLAKIRRALLYGLASRLGGWKRQRICQQGAVTARDRILAFYFRTGNPPPERFTDLGAVHLTSNCELKKRGLYGTHRRRTIAYRLQYGCGSRHPAARRETGVVGDEPVGGRGQPGRCARYRHADVLRP